MKKGIPSITIPVQKVSSWADHGESSETIAKKLGITVEDLEYSLSSLAEKNRKSATRIRQRLATNDKKPKPQSHGTIQAAKPTIVTTSTAHAQPAKAQHPHPVTVEAPKETATKAAPIAKKTSTEAEELQLAIEKAEHALEAINTSQANAKHEREEAQQAALGYEQELKELAKKVKLAKDSYEAELSKLESAEATLISCEGRRAETTARLAELKARLLTVQKPEIYVCDGEIQGENITIPEKIDTSRWAEMYDWLPEEIGNELRKKDAELLIRLRAIVAATGRDDAELVFESEILQKAYEALEATNIATI